MIERARADADDHRPGGRIGIRRVFVLKNVGTSMAMEANGFQCDGMLSEGFGREHDRIAEVEAAKILADDVDVADDERGETGGIEVALHHA